MKANTTETTRIKREFESKISNMNKQLARVRTIFSPIFKH